MLGRPTAHCSASGTAGTGLAEDDFTVAVFTTAQAILNTSF